MYSYGRDDGPAVGGGLIGAFLLIVALTSLAFAAVGAGAFDRKPPATLKLLLPQDEIGPASTPAPLDLSPTSSTAKPSGTEGRSCNIEACAQAFRSFRSSDCTFQPFEGPRRLCTR
jgi:hypothetical protein